MIGASSSNTWRMPRWPRVMSSWWLIGVAFVPMTDTSRPDDHAFPSPRQMTARTSGRFFSSVRMSNRRASISSSKALRLSGLLFVIVAMGPFTSRMTLSGTSLPSFDEWERTREICHKSASVGQPKVPPAVSPQVVSVTTDFSHQQSCPLLRTPAGRISGKPTEPARVAQRPDSHCENRLRYRRGRTTTFS